MNTINTVYQYIEIDYLDPICGIALNDHQLVFGSMMGRSVVFTIEDKKKYLLFSSASEHITGCEVYNDKHFSIAVGDYEVIHYTPAKEGLYDSVKVKNYQSENEHNMKCDSTYTAIKDIFLLRVFLKTAESMTEKQEQKSCDYVIKNLNNNEWDNGSFDMSNYIVPFDFNGMMFCWIDFYSKTERAICKFNFREKKLSKIDLKEEYGHISHMKMLHDNRLFIVRKEFICEIRNEKFEVSQCFGHIGKEVLACDWIMKESKLLIGLLDIEGNVNLYNEDSDMIEKKFNMYDLYGISTEEKERHFFSKGFPYYIKLNKHFVAVTTDYGCYLIRYTSKE